MPKEKSVKSARFPYLIVATTLNLCRRNIRKSRFLSTHLIVVTTLSLCRRNNRNRQSECLDLLRFWSLRFPRRDHQAAAVRRAFDRPPGGVRRLQRAGTMPASRNNAAKDAAAIITCSPDPLFPNPGPPLLDQSTRVRNPPIARSFSPRMSHARASGVSSIATPSLS
jgi:hypothetical protein